MIIYLLFILSISINFESTSGKRCDLLPYHEAGEKHYKLDCRNKILTYIPRCQEISLNCSFIFELILSKNRIQRLPSSGFSDYWNLRSLDISYNPVTQIQKDTFNGLSKLQNLTMTYLNNRSPGSVRISNETFRDLTSLRYLDLTGSHSMNIYDLFDSFCSLTRLDSLIMDKILKYSKSIKLDGELTSCLRNLNLKRISMNSARIAEFTGGFVMRVKSLHYASLSNNLIEDDNINIRGFTVIPVVHNLEYLDGSCQHMEGHAPCYEPFEWQDWLPNEPKMFQKQSSIVPSTTVNTTLIKVSFLTKLHTVIFRHNEVSETSARFDQFCWDNNTIINVDLAYSQGLHLYHSVPCFRHLRFLNLQNSENLILPKDFFTQMISLEVLLLGSAKDLPVPRLPTDSFLNLSNNIHLQFLDISGLSLKYIPNDFLSQLKRLEVLILNKNEIDDVSQIKNLQALTHVDLSSNLLRDIPLDIIYQLENRFNSQHQKKKVQLRLSKNPILCTCSSLYKIQILLQSVIHIEDLHKRNGILRCILPDDKRSVSFPDAFDILKQQCNQVDNTLFVLYLLLLIAMLVFSCCIRYRWRIVYTWYVSMQMVPAKENSGSDCVFDAFIAFSAADETWVRTNLIRQLEEGNKPYNLCVHDRNFLPGEYIAVNIISAIEASRRTILVVTKKFIKSNWCYFETQAAQSHHILNQKKALIAIVFPGVHKAANKNRVLSQVLDMVTYLEWPAREEERSDFWLKLKTALGKPKRTDSQNIADDRVMMI